MRTPPMFRPEVFSPTFNGSQGDDITGVFNHPAIQQQIENFGGDERTNQIIKNIQAIRNSGIFDAPKQGWGDRIQNALFAGGDALTGSNNYATKMNNEALMRRQQMENIRLLSQQNTDVPLITIGPDGKPVFTQNVPRNSIVRNQPASSSSLTPEDVDMAGQQLANGDLVPSQIPGRNGRLQAINAAKKLDPNYNAAEADMNFAVNKMGAGQFVKNFNNIDSFHRNFSKNADYLLTLNDDFLRSASPLANRAIVNGSTEIAGDPKATRFTQAIYTVAMEYARLQNPTLSGQNLSDAARKEALDMLSKYNSSSQMRALLDPNEGSMRVESNNRVDTAREKLKEIMDLKGGGSVGRESSSGATGTVTMTSPSGKVYTFSADQAEEARKNGWK